MKRVISIVLCVLMCAAMLGGCSKPETFEGEGYRLQYDANLWKCTRREITHFIFGTVVFLPVSSTVFPEQKTRINGRVINMLDPHITIYEYPIPDGVEALDEHFESFILNENDMYPDFTFNSLTPVAQRQCDVRINLGENDYATCYLCAFNTDEGSIVIECEYISDSTWSKMQKILNTLEIL